MHIMNLDLDTNAKALLVFRGSINFGKITGASGWNL